MAVDNYSDLQKFEHPITFDMVEEDLIAAEEFLSKQLWYSTMRGILIYSCKKP